MSLGTVMQVRFVVSIKRVYTRTRNNESQLRIRCRALLSSLILTSSDFSQKDLQSSFRLESSRVVSAAGIRRHRGQTVRPGLNLKPTNYGRRIVPLRGRLAGERANNLRVDVVRAFCFVRGRRRNAPKSRRGPDPIGTFRARTGNSRNKTAR